MLDSKRAPIISACATLYRREVQRRQIIPGDTEKNVNLVFPALKGLNTEIIGSLMLHRDQEVHEFG